MEFNNRLLLKIIELVFTLTAVILVESVSDHSYSSQAMVVCGTLSGYLIICSALLIGHLLGAPIDKRIDCLFSIGASIMFIATGAVIIDQWCGYYTEPPDKNALLIAGSMAIINGAIFILDTIVIGIAIACIVLWETVGVLSARPMIVCGTVGGFTIICGVLLIGHILNSIVEKRLNALISIIGCILFVISGALVIDEWHDSSDLLFKERKRNALAAGSLMIINGAAFLLDTLSICRTRQNIPIIREVSKKEYDLERY